MQKGKVRKEKKRGRLLIKIAVLCLTIIVVLSLVERQVQIAEKREQLEQLQAQLEQQDLKNQELRSSLEDEDGMRRYAEKRAREDLDYVKPRERVFVDGE